MAEQDKKNKVVTGELKSLASSGNANPPATEAEPFAPEGTILMYSAPPPAAQPQPPSKKRTGQPVSIGGRTTAEAIPLKNVKPPTGAQRVLQQPSQAPANPQRQLAPTVPPISYSYSTVNLPANEFSRDSGRRDALPSGAHEERLLLEEPCRIIEHPLQINGTDPALVMFHQPGSAAAEQYRVLALKLRENKKIRVLAVTAPTNEERGAVVAGNLALALAEGGRTKVMLLEASLRRPELDGLFNLPFIAPSLCEQLRYHQQNPQAKWEVWKFSPNLSLLTTNQIEGHPASLLNLDAMSDLMSELRHVYNYTIVSLPPLMTSADANIIQDHFDAALLVVRAGVTRGPLVKESIGRLGRERFCGCVLLDAPPSEHLTSF